MPKERESFEAVHLSTIPRFVISARTRLRLGGLVELPEVFEIGRYGWRPVSDHPPALGTAPSLGDHFSDSVLLEILQPLSGSAFVVLAVAHLRGADVEHERTDSTLRRWRIRRAGEGWIDLLSLVQKPLERGKEGGESIGGEQPHWQAGTPVDRVLGDLHAGYFV